MGIKMGQKETLAEIDSAFALFEDKKEGVITVESLMNVAKILEDNMSEEEIKEMLLAASASSNEEKKNYRVTKDDFKYIIRKATNQ
jgi:Ca2+-binding EF-hand superfamily protein